MFFLIVYVKPVWRLLVSAEVSDLLLLFWNSTAIWNKTHIVTIQEKIYIFLHKMSSRYVTHTL